MITLKEIAEEAGVSATTVSNVLHGKSNKVSPQLVEKIQALLNKHNYVPRFGLNALTSRGSKMIGVLISTPEFLGDNLYEKPFYGRVIGVLERIFRRRGYYMIVFSSKDIYEIMRMTLGWNVDGVISITMAKQYCQKIGEMCNKPVVSIDMDVNDEKEAEDSYNVTSTDFDSGGMMVKYLYEKGIKEIVFLTNVMRGADCRRYLGAKEAYQNYYHKDNMRILMLARSFEGRISQYNELEELIGKNAALFFSTDLNAAEAIGYYTRAGYTLPQDLSIVGNDDDIYASLSVPRLTTIRADNTAKAEAAAKMLLDIVEGQQRVSKICKIQVELIERESVFIQQEQEAEKK